jgi:hypothetical protein
VAIFRAFRGLTTVTQEIFHELEKNWQPVKGDFAAHGRFDKCAKPGTAQLLDYPLPRADHASLACRRSMGLLALARQQREIKNYW